MTQPPAVGHAAPVPDVTINHSTAAWEIVWPIALTLVVVAIVIEVLARRRHTRHIERYGLLYTSVRDLAKLVIVALRIQKRRATQTERAEIDVAAKAFALGEEIEVRDDEEDRCRARDRRRPVA